MSTVEILRYTQIVLCLIGSCFIILSIRKYKQHRHYLAVLLWILFVIFIYNLLRMFGIPENIDVANMASQAIRIFVILVIMSRGITLWVSK